MMEISLDNMVEVFTSGCYFIHVIIIHYIKLHLFKNNIVYLTICNFNILKSVFFWVVNDKCVGFNNIVLLMKNIIEKQKSKNVGDLVAIIYRTNKVVDKNRS